MRQAVLVKNVEDCGKSAAAGGAFDFVERNDYFLCEDFLVAAEEGGQGICEHFGWRGFDADLRDDLADVSLRRRNEL